MWSSKPAVRQDTFVGSIATPWALEDLSLPTRPIALDTRQAATGSEESIQALESEREALTREIAALQERMEQQVGEALERGRAEGAEAGRQAERERLTDAFEAAKAAVAKAEVRDQGWMEAREENMTTLAVAIARQIIGREIRSDRKAIVELVRRAVSEFTPDQALNVRIHPVDLSLLSDPTSAADDTVPISAGRDVSWTADPTIERGGCVVEGPHRIVDGRVDTALERVYRRLTGNHA